MENKNSNDPKENPQTPKLTDQEILQAVTDALAAIVTAVGYQTDPVRLFSDLKALADFAEKRGNGPSAGLIDELAKTVEIRLLKRKGDH